MGVIRQSNVNFIISCTVFSSAVSVLKILNIPVAAQDMCPIMFLLISGISPFSAFYTTVNCSNVSVIWPSALLAHY